MLAIPAVPPSFGRADLVTSGFVGWRTWDQLRHSELREVPSAPVAYVVFWSGMSRPSFAERNPGGRFRGKDPSVPVELLAAKWVPDAAVVYIGKADDAQRRLTQFSGLEPASR